MSQEQRLRDRTLIGPAQCRGPTGFVNLCDTPSDCAHVMRRREANKTCSKRSHMNPVADLVALFSPTSARSITIVCQHSQGTCECRQRQRDPIRSTAMNLVWFLRAATALLDCDLLGLAVLDRNHPGQSNRHTRIHNQIQFMLSTSSETRCV